MENEQTMQNVKQSQQKPEEQKIQIPNSLYKEVSDMSRRLTNIAEIHEILIREVSFKEEELKKLKNKNLELENKISELTKSLKEQEVKKQYIGNESIS